jgi:serine/threonine protein kinase
MSNLIGHSLGRYHILEQLGEGGMATVYKAFDTRLETDVAVKVIRTENLTLGTMERALKRFEREAKALARLTHPNIVKVTDYGEYEGKPYLVMEYLPGGTLKERLGQPIPWQEAIRLMIPIAEALDFAHSQHMIHRDVKPSNILLTERGQPMLTDFGIAKILDLDETADLTGTGMGVGTPEYMAPEQWQGQVSEQTDVYALGVTLFEMVTRRRPYTAETPAALLIKQTNDPLPRPKSLLPELPDAVEKILLKALAKAPPDRYESMLAFSNALQSVLERKNFNETPQPKQASQEETQEIKTQSIISPSQKASIRQKSSLKFAWIIGMIAVVIAAIVFGVINGMPTAVLPASTNTIESLLSPIHTPSATNTPKDMPTLISTHTSKFTATPNTDFLFSEDFEDGLADDFKNKLGLWIVVSETSTNKVLDINSMDSSSEYPSIEFGEASWNDFIFESRVKFVEYSPTNDAPLTSIVFRGNYSVAFTPYWKVFGLVFNPPYTVITERTQVTQKNIWYLVRIQAEGSQFNVYLDDRLMISETVSRNSSGLFGFGIWPRVHIQFDDIVIKPIAK